VTRVLSEVNDSALPGIHRPPIRGASGLRLWLLHLALLAACCGAAGAASVFMGKDVDWDLLNYNVYALLHGRVGWDVAPAQLQTYLNPVFDFPFYFLVTHIANPRWVTFGIGALQGVSVYLAVQVVWTFLQEYRPFWRALYSGAALAVGLTGASGVPVLGTVLVGWEPTGFVLAGILLLLKAQLPRTRAQQYVLHGVAGLLVGLAVGGKLTMGPYAVGLAVALFLYRGVNLERLWMTSAFCVSVLIGVVVTDGFWAALLYEKFGSPLFPFFNNVFHSPYWENAPLVDERFKPRNLSQWIAYPFYWLRLNHSLVTELVFRDLRFAAVFSCMVFVLIQRGLNRINGAELAMVPLDARRRLLLIFFLLSYVIWEAMFSIYRYILPLEVLTGLVLFVVLEQALISLTWRAAVLVVLGAVIVGTTVYPNWGRAKFGDRYFAIDVPKLPGNSLVVMAGTAPMAYVVPMLGADVRVVAIQNNLLNPSQNNLLIKSARRIVAHNRGPMFSLSAAGDDKNVDGAYAAFGLRRDLTRCTELTLKGGGDMLSVCPLNRIAAVGTEVPG